MRGEKRGWRSQYIKNKAQGTLRRGGKAEESDTGHAWRCMGANLKSNDGHETSSGTALSATVPYSRDGFPSDFLALIGEVT